MLINMAPELDVEVVLLDIGRFVPTQLLFLVALTSTSNASEDISQLQPQASTLRRSRVAYMADIFGVQKEPCVPSRSSRMCS